MINRQLKRLTINACRALGIDGKLKLPSNLDISEIIVVNDLSITQDELEAKVKELEAECEAEQATKKQKTEGKLYPDTEYTVSFTKDDAMGMLQVKAAFELGLTETIIEFSNGTKMPMKADDFADFAKWFVIERNSFFV